MIHHTREELWSLYDEAGSVPDTAGISLVLRYLQTMLLTPFNDETDIDIDIDSSDNIYEKLKDRAENPTTDADRIGIKGVPAMGGRVTVADFFKRMIFEIPLENMPLFIEESTPERVVAAWRLRIGK